MPARSVSSSSRSCSDSSASAILPATIAARSASLAERSVVPCTFVGSSADLQVRVQAGLKGLHYNPFSHRTDGGTATPLLTYCSRSHVANNGLRIAAGLVAAPI